MGFPSFRSVGFRDTARRLEHSMSRSRDWKAFVKGLAVCTAYVVAAKLSLRLASIHPSATPVWPPTGIAIATLVALGLRFWPSIFIGAFLVNLTTAGSVLTSIGIATGNTLEALLASFLVVRFASGPKVFEKSWDILRFALYAGILSTAVAATLGVTSLALGGFAPWKQYGVIWRTWWLGDAAGALIFTPFLLLWGANLSLKWTKRQLVEAGVLIVSLMITAGMVFGVIFHARMSGDPWTFLCTPFLVWIAFRFGQQESSAAICLLSVIAVVGTVDGRGPFVRETSNDALGHVVGSLALCRMAEVLHLSCRAIDTPARYGGDEFALVLPGTPSEAARRVAQRISQRLAEDIEVPRLSASIGIAEYPRDGLTIEHLLSAADRALYEEKNRHTNRPSVTQSS